jgi:hypothetical protein
LQTALDGKYSTANPSGYITASALTPYAPLNNPTFTGTVSGITKAMVGLGNVDNTADAVKSVSYASTSGNADTVDGYNVQVDGTGTNPNTIYFKTTGGEITVDWDNVLNTPTTVAGYGITDAVTTSGNQTIGGTKTFSSTISGSIDGNSNTIDGYHVQVDGTGTDPNTIYFKTTGGVDPSSAVWGSITGTLSAQTDLQSALDGKVALAGTQTITGNKTFTGSVTMGQSGGGEGGEILWLDPVQGTVCTDIPASGFFRVFQTSGTAKGAYIDLANCAGGVGSLLLHSTNYNSYAPTLTGGGASGSWGISVTGNAGTVTNGVYTTGNQTIGGTKSFSTSPVYSDTDFQYHQHTSAHIAYIKKTGAYNWYWRRNDTGLLGGANESQLMELFDSGLLNVSGSVYAQSGDMRAQIFRDIDNTAYYLDPANTGTSMVVAGNVGIGTTSLVTKLDVNGDVNTAQNSFISSNLYFSGGWKYKENGYGGFLKLAESAGGVSLYTSGLNSSGSGASATVIQAIVASASGSVTAPVDMRSPIFYDSNNTAFYVNPNGTSNISALVMNDLLTGRSSASTDVNGANDTGSFSVRGSSTTVASMSFHRTGAYAINMGLGTDNVFRIGGWSASSNAFQMDGSGNLTMLNNVTAYSDARLKTDIVKIENALDKVQQLNGYTYTRTDTGSRQCGVIAQEVMKVLPEVVMGSEETNYSVAYGNMVGLLIEAMKEQQAQIDELKLTIEQLKGN